MTFLLLNQVIKNFVVHVCEQQRMHLYYSLSGKFNSETWCIYFLLNITSLRSLVCGHGSYSVTNTYNRSSRDDPPQLL